MRASSAESCARLNEAAASVGKVACSCHCSFSPARMPLDGCEQVRVVETRTLRSKTRWRRAPKFVPSTIATARHACSSESSRDLVALSTGCALNDLES
jgi:hypothetical protein